MKPGTKPKPRHLKVVEGERKDRIPDAVPTRDDDLTRPGWLLTEAKREWTRVVGQVEDWGAGQRNRMALASLCQEWARYVQCQKLIDEEGAVFETPSGYKQQHPAVSMANKHFNNVRKMCAEFGLTLSSEGRITVPGEAGGGDADRLLTS